MSLFKVLKLKQTCSVCPSQWEGELDNGKKIYVRYRWGFLSVRSGETVQDAILGGEVIFEDQLGDGMDGDLSQSELRKALKDKLDFSSI